MEPDRPVSGDRIPYGRHHVTEEDIEAVVEALKSDRLTTGPRVEEFEDAFAAEVGAAFAVGYSSGTAALHGAAYAAGIGPGDEVVTTSLTFCATVSCVLHVGGKPVLADISPDTMNLDPDRVKAALTDRTKAIVPVDYAGHPADLAPILELAREVGAIVIEDASHALGGSYREERIGSISNLSVFSFHPVKHITTGEGGMVTTDDPSLAARLRSFRNHGIDRDAEERRRAAQWSYDVAFPAFNYRLNDIAAALGRSQLRRLQRNVKRRAEIARRFSEAFRDLPIATPIEREACRSAWHLYVIRVKEGAARDRDGVFRYLWDRGVESNVHYVPIHFHSAFEELGYEKGDLPEVEAAFDEILTLPLFPEMQDADIDRVVSSVVEAVTRDGD